MNQGGHWAILAIALLCLTSVSLAAEVARPYAKEAVQHYNEAVRLHQSGFLSQAESEYKAAIEADGRMEQAWSNLGVVYIAQKDLEAARNALRKSIFLNPNQSLNFKRYAQVLDAMGEHKAAGEARAHAQGLDRNHELSTQTRKDWEPHPYSKDEVQQFLKGKTNTLHGDFDDP